MTKIHEIFRDSIKREINSVVKVQDSNLTHTYQELKEYVITEQIRSHYKKVFQNYLEGNKYCYWISGWFGSGKSHFTKLFGHVLGNYQFEDTTSIDVFLSRDESSELRPLVEKIRDQYQTEILMFDILEDTAYDSENKQQSISTTIYKQFLAKLGFYSHILWVGELEYELYEEGLYEIFKIEFEKVSGKKWEELREKPSRQKTKIAKTLSKIKAEDYPSETIALDAINSIQSDYSMSPKRLIEIFKSYIENSPVKNGKQKRLLLLIDEMGQFMARDDQKISELQGIAHQVEVTGKGKIWLAVTAQEELKAVVEDAIKFNDELGKIADRFEVKIHLTPENLDSVLYERILKKNTEAKTLLEGEYDNYSGKIESILDFPDADRTFPKITKELFVKAYPFFPYQLGIIKDIFVKFLQRTETNKKHGGTNRSMIKTAQGILTNTQNQFDTLEIGAFVTLDQIYAEARASDFVPSTVIDAVNEVDKIDPENAEFTKSVLKVLYLLDSINYLPRTLENITKLLLHSIELNIHELKAQVESSLKKLWNGGFIEKEGEVYSFLSPEERNFRHEIIAEQEDIRSRAVLLYIRDVLKETFNQNKVNYKQIRVFSVEMWADEEKYAAGSNISFEALSPVALANDEMIRDKRKRDSISKEKQIYWLAKPSDEMEDMVREYLARQVAITKQREKADEEKMFFLRKEEQKNRNLALEIHRKMKAAFQAGSYIYRGQEFDLPKGEEIKSIFDALISIVIPKVYTRFDDVGVKINASHIDEVFKDKLHSSSIVFSELNVLDREYQVNPSAKVINEVLSEIRSRYNRHGICTGNDLLEYFSENQYGWDTMAIRFIISLLFRGGFIELEYKGKTIISYTESGVKEIFEKEPHFKTCQFVEVKNVDPSIRQQCRQILESEFEEKVEADTIPEYYEKSVKVANQLLRQVKGLIVTAKSHQLIFSSQLEKIESSYEKVINKHHASESIIEFVNVFQVLKDDMVLMKKFERFVANDNIKSIGQIKTFIKDIWETQHFPKTVDQQQKAQAIWTEIASVAFMDNWVNIQGDYQELTSSYNKHHQAIHEKVMKEIESIIEEIELFPQFDMIEAAGQRAILEPVSKHYVPDFSKERRGYDYLEQLSNALASYKQATIALYGEQIEKLNRPIVVTSGSQDTEKEVKIKPKFKQVRVNDLMMMRRISSDEELQDYLKTLEEKLKEELIKVDYFFLS